MDFSKIPDLFIHLAKLVTVFLIALLLLRGNKKLRKAMISSRMNFDPGWVETFSRLAAVFISSLSILLGLQILGFNVTPFLAFGGIGAALLGISGKDLISNFSGGWMVRFTRPFFEQDQIELPQRNITGSIEKIGWYSTAIRSKNTQLIWVPNSLFTTDIIINQSRMTHRRIDQTLLLSIEGIESIVAVIKKIFDFLKNHPEVDPTALLDVHVTDLSAIAVEITWTAHVYKTRYEDYMEVKQLLILGVLQIAQEQGMKLSYPTTQVYAIKQN